MTDSDIRLSRKPDPERRFGEVRCMVPVELLQVLDAVSLHEQTDRTTKVTRILRDWAKQEALKASLITRVMRGNPDTLDWDDEQ